MTKILPKRIDQHIIEDQSFAQLLGCCRNMLFREISRRDYGIDLLAELMEEDGRLAGRLLTIQLKGTRKGNRFKIEESTLNYLVDNKLPAIGVFINVDQKSIRVFDIKKIYRIFYPKNHIDIKAEFISQEEFSTEEIIKDIYFAQENWYDAIESTYRLFANFYVYSRAVLQVRKNIMYSINEQYGITLISVVGTYLKDALMCAKVFNHRYVGELVKINSNFNWNIQDSIDAIEAFSSACEFVVSLKSTLIQNFENYIKDCYPELWRLISGDNFDLIQEDWYARYYFAEFVEEIGYYALIDPSYTHQIDPPKLTARF
jgi:Domain of unknown function (DUF4365)